MIPAQSIAQARVFLNDPYAGTPRWSDADLLGYYNDYRKALALAKRSLFATPTEHVLTAGPLQTVSRLTTNGILTVLSNSDGLEVEKADRLTIGMNRQTIALLVKLGASPVDISALGDLNLAWRNDATGKPIRYAPLEEDPFSFLVYPKATAGDTLTVIVSSIPEDVTNVDVDDGISAAYRAASSTYVAGRALAVNTNAKDMEKGAAMLKAAMDMSVVS